MDHQPWLNVERWRNGQIKIENLAIQFYVMLGFFIVWTGLFTPALINEWSSLMRHWHKWHITDFDTFDLKLVLLVLPVFSLLMLKPLVRFWSDWRTLKGISLTLDPYPGQIGGQVGGYLSVPFKHQPDMPVDVRVSCVRASISGSGKNRRRSDRVEWRTKARSDIQYETQQSSRITFVADIDDKLASSDLKEETPYIYWSVRIQLANRKFDQEFNIPVFDTGDAASSRLFVEENNEDNDSEVPLTTADFRKTEEGYAVHFPAGRSGIMGNVLAIVGLIFSGVAIFMWYTVVDTLQADKIHYFPLLVEFMIGSGFTLFGLPLFLWGLFEKYNSLSVILDKDWMLISRSAFGKTFQELIPRNEVHSLSKKVTAQSGQGAKSEIYYTIKLETTQGRKHNIADGIHGQPAADELLELMKEPLEFYPKQPLDKKKLPMPFWLKGLLFGLKLLSSLAVALTIAAFVYDFMNL